MHPLLPTVYGSNHGLSPRRTPARSLQLPRALPVLDRRGPRLRHLRHDRRVAFRQRHDRRCRRRRPDDRDDRARPGQHPAGKLDRRRLSRRQGDAAAGGRAPRRLHRARRAGPIAELAKLVGKVVSVEKVPVTFTVQGGHGTIKLGDAGYAELEPYKSASGQTTTLTDTVFSTVPGAPVFVGKATRYRSKNDKVGIDLDIKGHNALQSTFVFQS